MNIENLTDLFKQLEQYQQSKHTSKSLKLLTLLQHTKQTQLTQDLINYFISNSNNWNIDIIEGLKGKIIETGTNNTTTQTFINVVNIMINDSYYDRLLTQLINQIYDKNKKAASVFHIITTIDFEVLKNSKDEILFDEQLKISSINPELIEIIDEINLMTE